MLDRLEGWLMPYTESRWTRRRFLAWQTVILTLVLAAFVLGGKALLDVGDTADDTKDVARANSALILKVQAQADRLETLVSDFRAKVASDKESTAADLERALQLCKRALIFAPPIGRDMLNRGVFDQATYAAYIATLPDSCGGKARG